MKIKIILVFCSSTFFAASVIAQPLKNELTALTKSLTTLANSLNKKATPAISLESSQLENLPNEIILNIIQQSIPNHFETAEEMYTTIQSLLSLVTSSKRLNQFYIDVKNLLSNAIQKNKDTLIIPKGLDLERLELKDREQLKIINKALLEAFLDNNLGALKLLLENGANINTEYRTLSVSAHPFTLLMLALGKKDKNDEKTENEKMIQLLLSFVTAENAQQVLDHHTGYATPLGYAIQNKNLSGIELLFKTAKKWGVSQLFSRDELSRASGEFLRKIHQLAQDYGIFIS